MKLKDKRGVLQDGLPAQQLEILEDHADLAPQPRQLGPGHGGQVRPYGEGRLGADEDVGSAHQGLGAREAEGRDAEAIEHLAQAVEMDPGYSAAWKAYGKALAAAERNEEAAVAYSSGIAVAEEKGDIQAAKEMKGAGYVLGSSQRVLSIKRIAIISEKEIRRCTNMR